MKITQFDELSSVSPIVATYNQTNPIEYIQALHRATDGYITLFKKLADNKVTQRHYKLNQLDDDVIRDFVHYDCYVSLNSFYRMKRGNAHLRTLHNLYVDLDCYNVNMSVDSVMYALENDYFNQSIPTPNLVVYSGRGIQLIWNIEAISGLAIERWSIVQRAICDELKVFGADSQAIDASRVFRLPASVNSKSNEVVRYDQLHDHEYDLMELGEEYFDILPKQNCEKFPIKPHSKPKKRPSINIGINYYSLTQARLNDLETLIKLRSGKMNGHRERLLFLARYFALCITKNKQSAVKKIHFLNGLFDEPIGTCELIQATASAEEYFKGNGLNIGNKCIIEWLNITPVEQSKLSTIINKEEKSKRDRARKQKARRDSGVDTRVQYNRKRLKAVIRNAKRIKLAQCIFPNMSVREIAVKVGLSKTYVWKLLQDLDTYVDNIELLSTSNSPYIKRVVQALSILGLSMDLEELTKPELLVIKQQLIDYLQMGSSRNSIEPLPF